LNLDLELFYEKKVPTYNSYFISTKNSFSERSGKIRLFSYYLLYVSKSRNYSNRANFYWIDQKQSENGGLMLGTMGDGRKVEEEEGGRLFMTQSGNGKFALKSKTI
jgi:hypothetical protein